MMSGQRVGCHTIRCSECPNTKEVLDRGYRQLPFDEVERRFQKAKWFVGKNEKHDLCPDCVKRHTMDRLESFVSGTKGKRLTYKALIQ